MNLETEGIKLSETDQGKKKNNIVKVFFSRRSAGSLTGLFVIVLILVISTPSFFKINNILNIIDQITVNGILAIGMTLVIITGGIDLSVGSILALSMMTFGVLTIDFNLPYYLTISLAILAGTICGLINGILVAKVQIPPFIVTLAMMNIARGLANLVSNNTQRHGFSAWFAGLSGNRFLNLFSSTTSLLILLAIVLSVVMRYRRFGKSIYAIGFNANVTRLAGIKVDKIRVSVYAISGTLAGLAGVVLNSQLSSSQPYGGVGYELNAIAAVVIGGGSLRGGVGTIGGTFIGALIIGILRNGLNLNGVNVFIQQILIGVVIAATVALDMLRYNKE